MQPDKSRHIRHEMTPVTERDALSKLNELTDFLVNVKDGARLRAKEEGGVKFLHTRTGTIFGRILKRLTIAWPAAIEQRKLARKLIADVVSTIPAKNTEIDDLKDKILNTTLKLENNKEFNIPELRKQLSSLKTLAQSHIDQDSSRPKLADNSLKESSDLIEKKEDLFNFSSSAGNVDIPASEPDLIDTGRQVELLISDLPAVQTDSETTEIISQTTTASLADINKEVQSAPTERSKFGCIEIKSGLQCSKLHKVSDYNADAYIISSDKKNFKFTKGNINLENSEKISDGIFCSKGTHTFFDEKRDIRVLQFENINGEDPVLYNRMNDVEKQKHLQRLEQRYSKALSYVAENRAKRIVLEPLRQGITNIVPTDELTTLAKTINKFQKAHPEVKIQVVFVRQDEVVQFKSASDSAQ